MGLASSSAVRVDDAYGSLGGALSGGTERKLKKKPVLVLDPEELAKAHQLFQIGAAEQLGDYDPQERMGRPVTPLFGLATNNRFDDDEDDYVPPADAGAAQLSEDEEECEEDLPPIDLTAMLAQSAAEEEAFYADQEAAEEPATEPEPLAEAEAEAEAEIVAETALAPAPEPELPPAEIADAAPIAAPEPQPEPAAELPAAIPAEPEIVPGDALARIISRANAAPRPEPEVAPEPAELPAEEAVEQFADDTPPPAFSEPARHAPEPEAAEPAPVAEILAEVYDLAASSAVENVAAPFEEAPRSTLRARLVREDLTLAHPEPGLWRKLMIALRRWRMGF